MGSEEYTNMATTDNRRKTGCCEPCFRCQQSLLVCFRPSQIMPCCKKLRNAHIVWECKDVPALLTAFDNFCVEEEDVTSKSVKNTDTSVQLECVVVTPAGFCDYVRVHVEKSTGVVEARSASTAVCPRTCPGACCCSLMCCCFPHDDWSKNLDNLIRFERFCSRKGLELANRRVENYGQPGAANFTIIIDKQKVPLAQLMEDERWRVPNEKFHLWKA